MNCSRTPQKITDLLKKMHFLLDKNHPDFQYYKTYGRRFTKSQITKIRDLSINTGDKELFELTKQYIIEMANNNCI